MTVLGLGSSLLVIIIIIIGQSSFISFATRTERPLLKLRLVSNVQLVLPCNERQIGHYLALLFFGSNTRRASLLRPRPSTVSIANAVQRN